MKSSTDFNLFLSRILTCAALFLGIYLFVTTMNLAMIFNSDQLNLSYFFIDLFKHYGSLNQWTLSNTNYLFPDGFILLFYSLFSFKTGILLTYVSILFLYYITLVTLGVTICGKESKKIFNLSAILSIFLACGSLRQQEIFLPLLISHFGSTVIIYLITLYCLVKNLQTPQPIFSYLLFFINLFTYVSDPLAAVVIIPTTLLTAIILQKSLSSSQQKIIKNNLILLIIAALFSQLIVHLHLFGLHIKHTRVAFMLNKETVDTLFHAFAVYYQSNPIISLMTFLYCLITLLLIGLLHTSYRLKIINRLTLPGLFTLLSVGLCTPILIGFSLALDADLSDSGFIMLRHFEPTFILSLFLCVPILLIKLTSFEKFIKQAYLVIISCLCITLAYQSSATTLKSFYNFYSPLAECLDNHYQAGNLTGKQGIADYWDSHTTSLFSKSGLNIVAVRPDYRPYNWMSTSNDYLNKTFQFIVLRKNDNNFSTLQQNLIRFGKPKSILTCSKQSEYLIYTYADLILPDKKTEASLNK